MSPTDPGGFIHAAATMAPAEPPVFLPLDGAHARVRDDAAGDVPPATDPRPVESAGVDTTRAQRPRPYDPFDDPCNYLG